MENLKDKKEMYDKSVKDYIDNAISPIFNKVLQETKPNHSMVDNINKIHKKVVTPSLYNPHNYRLYLKFTKEHFTPKQGMVGVWFGKFKNYGKEFTSVGEGIRVTVKKNLVEVINKLSEQEWFFINRIKAKEEIAAVLNQIDAKCMLSLKKFIEVYGGNSDFKIIKAEGRPNLNLFTEADHKVMKEPFIDNIKLKEVFDTKIVKKVYKKPNVEFKEGIYAARYLENSALNEFSPEIANGLNTISSSINQLLTPAIEKLTVQINTHLAVQNEQLKNQKIMNKSLRLLNNKLSQSDLRKWV